MGLFASLIALALRALYIRESQELAGVATPPPGLDIDLAWRAARHLREGSDGPIFELIVQSAPLHVGWMMLMQNLFGESYLLHRYLTAIAGSARFVLIYPLALTFSGRGWIALLTTLSLATLPTLVYFDSVGLKTHLDITLLTLLIWTVLQSEPHRGRGAVIGWGLASGLVCSFAFLNQLNTFLYVAAVGAYALSHRAWPAARRWHYAGAVALVFLPVFAWFSILRPITATSAFSPQDGVHLRIGYNPKSSGTYTNLPLIPGYPYGHTYEARIAAELEVGRPLDLRESNRFHRDKAWRFWREQPAAAIKLTVKKALLFFNRHEAKGNDYFPWLESKSRLLQYLPLSFGLLVIWAAIGASALPRAGPLHRWLLLGVLLSAIAAANLLTFVSFRYRLPAIVVLAMLGALGLGRGAWDGSVRRGAWLARMLVVGLAIVCIQLPVVHERVKKSEWAKAEANARSAEAAAAFSLPREEAPTTGRDSRSAPDEDARPSFLRDLERQHRYTDAFRFASAALQRPDAPQSVQAWAAPVVARYLLWLGREDEARRLSQSAGAGSASHLGFSRPATEELLRRWAE